MSLTSKQTKWKAFKDAQANNANKVWLKAYLHTYLKLFRLYVLNSCLLFCSTPKYTLFFIVWRSLLSAN